MLSLLLRSLQKCLDVGHMYFIQGEGEQEEVSFFFLQYYLYSFSFLPLIIRGIQCQKQTPCLFVFFTATTIYLFITAVI